MFDPSCYECGSGFLPDAAPEGMKNELAQHIQDSIEMWLLGEKERLEALTTPQ